jgi:3-deoxy-D-manno-octulosonate 8-phosphate phosphatase KdsC-like HAD superfamily phosphatase
LRDISDRSTIYKNYWAQWKSFAVRDGVLVRRWQSTDGKKETAQLVVPCSKVKEVLAEMHASIS